MISIILTAYKEKDTIGKAISSILEQSFSEKYELLITAPDKETLDEAKKFAKKYKQIKVFQDKGIGKPSALNMVISKSSGNILILTDGDVYCRNCNDFLKHFKDPAVGAVSGHPISLNSKKTMAGYWSHFLFGLAHALRTSTSKNNEFLFCSGYFFALRKGIVDEIPPNVLDDAYISQIVWSKRFKIKYEKNALVFVKNPANVRDWIKQKKRNIYGEFQLRKYKKGSMRSLREEIVNSKYTFSIFPKNIKEFFWVMLLFLTRLYVWLEAFIDINIKKKSMKKMWVRIESTK